MDSSGDDLAANFVLGTTGAAPVPWWRSPRWQRHRLAAFVAYLGLIALVFIRPLARLIPYAYQSELHSYVLVIPLITAYLVYRGTSAHRPVHRTSFGGGVVLASVALLTLALQAQWRPGLSLNDDLTMTALTVVCLVVAGGFLFLGNEWMAAHAFPMSFLFFAVPMPDMARVWLENASVARSADAAAWLFRLTGTSHLRDGEVFELPGITLLVARECSGIHSTCVLFITSILGAYRSLTTGWRRAVLVAAVVPLGIMRNGARIAVIALLCVHYGPQMIDHPIHRRGGPIFFAMSLVPLLLLLVALRRSEQLTDARPTPQRRP